MTAYRTFPDAEAAAVAVLRAALTAQVVSELPHDAEGPIVAVRRVGGAPADRHALDAPELQIDTWAPTKAEAHDLAQRARVALFTASNTRVTYPGEMRTITVTISGVEDVMGLSYLADPSDSRDRYVFSVRMFTY